MLSALSDSLGASEPAPLDTRAFRGQQPRGAGSQAGKPRRLKAEPMPMNLHLVWLGSQRAFCDDREKLLALFPVDLQGQKFFKNAPFDVTESRLTMAAPP